MKIGILNECFFTSEHIKRLEQLGDVEITLDTNTKEKAIERIKDKEIIITDMFICPLTNDILDHAPNLKLISINSTGHDRLDLDYLNKRGITLTDTPNFSTDSVAEQIFALILTKARELMPALEDYKKEPFEILPDVPAHRKYLGFNLRGKTIGVLGLGNIGSRVCEIAKGFGMNVLGYNRSKKEIDGVKQTTLNELVKNSDIIAICLPLNKDSEGILGKKEFESMQEQTIIVSISNEKIFDQDALISALQEDKIAGIALDYISINEKSHPLLNTKNVLIAPHCGWFTKESLGNIGEIITQAVEAFTKGEEKYRVN